MQEGPTPRGDLADSSVESEPLCGDDQRLDAHATAIVG